jgi:uracil-DNA glycosylase family 4
LLAGKGQYVEGIHFLIQEYLSIWKEWGIEDLEKFRKSRALENKVRKTTQVKENVDQKISSLEDIRTWIGDCRRCRLCEERKNIVFGSGHSQAKLMFVGEGPGADEDEQGLPFVGRAGKLLTKIIEAMGYTRDQVYIANVVKCRPPNNRAPQPDESESCVPFLQKQVAIIKPSILVALGASATNALITASGGISTLRGKFHPLSWDKNVPVMPTFHPAYLLRNPNAKRYVWDDMKIVKNRLEAKQ